LFGLDRLVGFNDLRFFVDDSGTTEVMHIAGDGKIGLGKRRFIPASPHT